MSTPLTGCKQQGAVRLERIGTVSDVAHQRYDAAHRYLREHRLDSIKWDDATRHTSDVVIIGAGPSGLAAAVALHKAGWRIAVLDNEPVGGGAARMGAYRSMQYPLASIYFVEQTAAVRDLIDFAGVKPNTVAEDALLWDNSTFFNIWDDSTLNTLPITIHERNQLCRFRDDLLQLREHSRLPTYPLPETLPNWLTTLDRTTAAAYTARYSSTFLTTLLDMYCRSSMGGSLHDINAYAFLNFYASEINTPRYSFPGGLGALAQGIIAKLADHIITASTCIRISQSPSHVHAWATDRRGQLHRFDAKIGIVAIQKFMLPWMIEDLPTVQRNAMHALTYSPFLTVHLCSPKQIVPDAFDLWMPSGGKLFTDIINVQATYSSPIENAVASVYAPRSASDRQILQSSDVIATFAHQIAENVVACLPKTDSELIDEVHVFGWGHALVVPTPGSHSGVAQTARKPHGRLLFANTDNDSSPAFENAVEHGVRASEQAIALLKQ